MISSEIFGSVYKVRENQSLSDMSEESAPKCNCETAENEMSSGDSQSNSVLRCCVKQRNWLMLKNMRFSDVCFIVGAPPNTQKIHAHKIVLSDSGTVFKAMFGENWSSKSNEIEVPDVEAATFSSMLRFIYTDEVQLTADSVMKILYAAKKYGIVSLEERCSHFLKEGLCPENACLLLTQARLFDQSKLSESCLEVIDDDPEEAFMSDGFVTLDLAALRLILARDTLRIDEVDLFKAVVRWSVIECQRNSLVVSGENQRLVLDGTESLVRFPVMLEKEFASEVIPVDLLSKDDIINVFLYFNGILKTLPDFCSTPRSSKNPLVAQRLSEIYSSWSCSDQEDMIGFSFSQDVKLMGFGMYTPTNGSGPEMEMNITVKNQGTGTVLHQSTVGHKKNGDNNKFRVLFKKWIKLTADTPYFVIMKTPEPSCYYGQNGQQSVSVEDFKHGETVIVTFATIQDNGRTRLRKGQIPEILFDTFK